MYAMALHETTTGSKTLVVRSRTQKKGSEKNIHRRSLPSPGRNHITVAIIRLSFHKFAYLPFAPEQRQQHPKADKNYHQNIHRNDMARKRSKKSGEKARMKRQRRVVDREDDFCSVFTFFYIEPDKKADREIVKCATGSHHLS